MDSLTNHGLLGLGIGLVAVIIVLALVIIALVQIGRAAHLGASKRTNWTLAVLLAPVFGAIAWFAVGNRLRLD